MGPTDNSGLCKKQFVNTRFSTLFESLPLARPLNPKYATQNVFWNPMRPQSIQYPLQCTNCFSHRTSLREAIYAPRPILSISPTQQTKTKFIISTTNLLHPKAPTLKWWLQHSPFTKWSFLRCGTKLKNMSTKCCSSNTWDIILGQKTQKTRVWSHSLAPQSITPDFHIPSLELIGIKLVHFGCSMFEQPHWASCFQIRANKAAARGSCVILDVLPDVVRVSWTQNIFVIVVVVHTVFNIVFQGLRLNRTILLRQQIHVTRDQLVQFKLKCF